jgi:hypothetical protein
MIEKTIQEASNNDLDLEKQICLATKAVFFQARTAIPRTKIDTNTTTNSILSHQRNVNCCHIVLQTETVEVPLTLVNLLKIMHDIGFRFNEMID